MTGDTRQTATALATVLSCRYDMQAGRALAFGIPASRHFHITFNFWAEADDGSSTLRTGSFYAEKAIAQGTLFSITYDPDDPSRCSPAAST